MHAVRGAVLVRKDVQPEADIQREQGPASLLQEAGQRRAGAAQVRYQKAKHQSAATSDWISVTYRSSYNKTMGG